MGLVRNGILGALLSVGAFYIISPDLATRVFILFSKYEPMWSTPVCLAQSCKSTAATCFTDMNCVKTIGCVNSCMVEHVYSPERVAACAYICEMTVGYENKPFIDLMGCMMTNRCMADYPDDGICYGQDEDGVKHLKSIEDIKGDWWVVRGLNCGQDSTWPGGYDWYPCQHERFTKKADGGWMNTVTFCGGTEDVCTTPMMTTIANVSMPKPGVIKVEYLDAPLEPQIEQWRIVSQPTPDYALVLWCGRLPVLNYSGVLVISRNKNANNMPKSVEDEFRKYATKFGFSWEEMCPSNNDKCPE